MNGILFLFKPSIIPSKSVFKNGLVKGKKALNPSVVMFLFNFKLSSDIGIIDLKASACLNNGTEGWIIIEFNSEETFLLNKSKSCLAFSKVLFSIKELTL